MPNRTPEGGPITPRRPPAPRDEGVAAPPDEGHLGSYTRPEETLDVSEREHVPAPDLHRDLARHQVSSGSSLTLLIALAVLAMLTVIFFLYAAF